MEEKEKRDPKEDMKKEKASATDSLFFGNMITTPFNDAKAKGHIRLENMPPKANELALARSL